MSIVLMGLLVVMGLETATVGADDMKPLGSQKALLRQLDIRDFNSIIVDSAMTYEQAMGDNVVPEEGRTIHAAMKTHLRVVPVVYWGLNDNGQPDHRIHVGQIVAHKLLIQDTQQLFWKMFQLKFPIHSVIPQSAFGYNDQLSMAANNSSNYRPEDRSEHARGAAFDLNPFQNPFDTSVYNGALVQPEGAIYDPSAPGTIVKKGKEVREDWTSLHYEWGGGWGDPDADPPTDFFRVGYFDYQHFQLDFTRYTNFNAQLPLCMQNWTC